MAISPEKLERYKDFVSLHSAENDSYNPERGLGGLLSTLTPDPKIVVLAGMDQGTIYFTAKQLYYGKRDIAKSAPA
ncbi:hypothetical protein HYS92_01400 [Candidatus Daviesbacteria bacterium]|nr:hypothetical protein [Candidatus Daviesbacteria bacterium]